MNVFGRIGTTVIIAIGIAMLLSWISELDKNVVAPNGEPIVVFSEHRTRSITQENIVDELVSLGLATEIRRVAVGTSILEIDLIVRRSPLMAPVVESDMAELAKLALAESDNIGRIFIRVLEAGSEKKGDTLLLALAGAKGELNEQELQRLRDGESMPIEWLSGKMRLTETNRWRELSQ